MANNEKRNVEKAHGSGSSNAKLAVGGAAVGRSLVLAAIGSALVALAVYWCTLSGYLYPGESSDLYVQWKGLEPLTIPIHPIWGAVVTALGGGTATALNALAMLCGALSAGMICYLTGFFVFRTVSQEDSLKFVKGSALAAGITGAFTFTFSTAIWLTSTHMNVRQFDVFLALLLFMMFIPLAKWPRLVEVLSMLIGFFTGALLLESSIFAPLAAVLLLALIVTVVKNGSSCYVPAALFLLSMLGGFFLTFYSVADSFMALPNIKLGGFTDKGDVLKALLTSFARDTAGWFGPRSLVVILLAVVPFIACAFAAVRGLNNERTWSQYAFHGAMTICCVLATVTPLAPESILRETGNVPVATTTLIAVVCGYLAAYWYLLARVPLTVNDSDAKAEPVQKVGRKIAPVAGCTFAGLLFLAALANTFGLESDRGAFADACANEILDRMEDRTWLITDGLLDSHLRIAASTRGKELNIICIKQRKQAEYDAYCRQIADLIMEKNVSAGEVTGERLAFTLRELGMIDFIKTWFSNDTDISKKVSILRMPDFWFWAKCKPTPNGLIFNGMKDVRDFDGLKVKADFDELWKRMEPILHAEQGKGSKAIRDADNVTDRKRLELRRHMGFVANNIGVLLQDQAHDDEAFEMYDLVLEKIDCDNICALFNEYEMARVGKKAAQPRKRYLETKLKEIVEDTSSRYLLKPLSSYYGYIRSTQFFVMSGLSWARSGEPDYALAQIKYAVDLSGDTPPKELLNMMASYYAQGKQVQKSREAYNKVLSQDKNNHDALIGLWRISLQEGSFDKAKEYLERAVKSDASDPTLRFDSALLHIMNNKLDEARIALQKITDFQPHSLQAWALLAGVILQQADQAKSDAGRQKILAELENTILPKMEGIADTQRDFFVQMTRALMLLRKGSSPELMKQARAALEVAWRSRPIVSVGTMVLELDYKLQDKEGAEQHAVQIIRMERSHPFANWVMGSIRMGEGRFPEAEIYLREAIDSDHPYPAAQNDLAELCRQQKRYEEAEKFARAATETDPKLYIAWETLCATLLDQNKDLDKAEEYINKALVLSNDMDLRMQLTLARVQIARKNYPKARATLRALGRRAEELGDADKALYEQLDAMAKGNGKAEGDNK